MKEIVRHKDVVFSQLLNRIRSRSKGVPVLADDIKILKSRETGEASSNLHIFVTNEQVNTHNINQLFEHCPDYVLIKSEDYINDQITGKLKLLEGSHAKAPNAFVGSIALG